MSLAISALITALWNMEEEVKPSKQIRCPNCSGFGQVSDYGAFGAGDFEGAEECETCEGSGLITRYESGTLAAYPGGPLLGREGKKEALETTK